MKDIKNSKKTSFFKKLFVKICRKLGYEIIDQNSFEVVTSNKILTDDLSKLGFNSINLPLGEVKVTRKVKALDIIVRTCASVNMLTQNKTRLFEESKIESTEELNNEDSNTFDEFESNTINCIVWFSIFILILIISEIEVKSIIKVLEFIFQFILF